MTGYDTGGQDAKSDNKRQIIFVVSFIIAISLPMVGVLAWYQVTKNPHILPLAMAIKVVQGKKADVTLEVEVAWVEGASRGLSQAKVRDAFIHSFEAKGVEAQIRFVPGEDVTLVRYRVGQNTIGPFQLDYAAGGINAAVDALHLQRKFYPAPPP